MITPVVRELKRVSPHGMRVVAPIVPASQLVTATLGSTTVVAHDRRTAPATTR